MPLTSSALQSRPILMLAAVGACYWSAAIGDAVRLAGRDPFPLGDFFAFWSSARILASHPASVLYDTQALHALQLGLGMGPGDAAIPYPYPPHAALLLLPMGGLGYWAAAAVWVGGGLAAYVAALAAGHGWARWVALAAVLAPTSAICFAFGQGGFVVGALLIGGLRLAPGRPVLAGLLFGLLTYKPQLGLMVPIALVAAGNWRCVGATLGWISGLAGVVTLWQGAAVWGAWLDYLPAYQAWFAGRALTHMPTVEAGLAMLHAPDAVIHAGQALAALLGAASVWQAFRRRHPCRVPIALAATALATPHGFIYDLPLLTGGVILFAADRLRTGMGWSEAAALLAILAFPVALNVPRWDVPIAPAMLLLALGVFVRGGSPSWGEPGRFDAGLSPQE